MDCGRVVCGRVLCGLVEGRKLVDGRYVLTPLYLLVGVVVVPVAPGRTFTPVCGRVVVTGRLPVVVDGRELKLPLGRVAEDGVVVVAAVPGRTFTPVCGR